MRDDEHRIRFLIGNSYIQVDGHVTIIDIDPVSPSFSTNKSGMYTTTNCIGRGRMKCFEDHKKLVSLGSRTGKVF